MNALAHDTGGRTVFNTNALDVGLAKALNETSVYYLLAWKPEQGTLSNSKAPAPDRHGSLTANLVVRVRQGASYLQPTGDSASAKAKEKPATPKTPEAVLREALTGSYPSPDLPVALTLNFLNTNERGVLLTASVQLNTDTLTFSDRDGQQKALLDLLGAIYNDQGQAGDSFKDQLTVTATSPDQPTTQRSGSSL